ncbi:MAG: class I SAM-dependent methyltransferase [Anaerolineae bacterium]|nr:class I SAM-dependent methyltransferase [Anaerolineae bacterium]
MSNENLLNRRRDHIPPVQSTAADQNSGICNLCGSSQYHVLFYRQPYTRVRCDRCGLIWSLEPPSAAALAAMYEEGYFTGDTYFDYIRNQDTIERNARIQLQRVHAYIKPPGVVVDIGCAAGFFLNVCRQAGWQTKGLELSGYASAYARERLGLDVFTGTLDETDYETGAVDLVTLWDVIEHVADPRETLTQAAGLLRTGGILALSTGDVRSIMSRLLGKWWRLITSDHLYYFSVPTIRHYLQIVGLETITIQYHGRFVSPQLAAHMLFNNYIDVPARLRDWFIYIAGLLPDLPLNLWDVMTVYARKP